MKTDLHQHLWTTPLLDALEQRECPPFIRRSDGVAVVTCAGEQPYAIDVAAQGPGRRQAQLRADGLDRAVIAISSPLGIEALPRAQAQPLIDAHLNGVAALGSAFAAWGPVALDDAGPADVDRVLDRGCIGISIPAGALADHDRLAALDPLLNRVAERAVPLLVHPGPALGDRPAEPALGDPLWWPAVSRYVSQMQLAWLTFVTAGRREHPELEIVFAMLAGGAPLLSERLELRGGPAVALRDPHTHYDTSGYGPALVETTARLVGERQLVFGSDRPVVDPPLLGREALLARNADRLFAGVLVRAAA